MSARAGHRRIDGLPVLGALSATAGALSAGFAVSRSRRIAVRCGIGAESNAYFAYVRHPFRGTPAVNVARRLADRKRHTPAAYSPEQTARLRKLIAAGRTFVACPQCGDELRLDPPVTIHHTNVWEVHCPQCFRSAMITDVTTAKIIIVDDDAIVRDTLNIVLTRAGHRVREFGEAESAMMSYRADPADLVLVDIFMPGMGGIEFIRRLLREFPGTKVIAMSGQRRHGAPDPLATAKGLGATQSLRKPFSPPELLQVVDQVLGVRPRRSRS